MMDEKEAQLLRPIDPFLRVLVDIANGGKNEFGVTLIVGGFLVSGILVGVRKYYEGFTNTFAGGIPNKEDAERISQALMQMCPPQDAELAPAECIHLQSAHFFTAAADPIPSGDGVWWRGRLSEVGGFHLGILGAVRTNGPGAR
jgi:hypothetical protein